MDITRTTCNQYVGCLYDKNGGEELIYKKGLASAFLVHNEIMTNTHTPPDKRQEFHFLDDKTIFLNKIDCMALYGIEKIYTPKNVKFGEIDFSKNKRLKEIVIEEGAYIESIHCKEVPNLQKIYVPKTTKQVNADRNALTQEQITILDKRGTVTNIFY